MAQENITYQKPPKEILDLVDYKRPPTVMLSDKTNTLIFFYRNTYKTLKEISAKEMRLAGLRINPNTNISSNITYTVDLATKSLNSDNINKIKGLPANPQLANFVLSPDEKFLAFTHTNNKGLELWVLDILNNNAKKVFDKFLNANLGNPIIWNKDNKSLFVNVFPVKRTSIIENTDVLPTGPIVSVSDGSKAQNRTYQDLLKNKTDEQNFETLATSALYKVSLNGTSSLFKENAMYSDKEISPDGKYILISTIEKPFSYIVPYYRFPEVMNVYSMNGELVKQIYKKPLTETLPQGFMAVNTGKRNIGWRKDKPSTLFWVKALDDGDPAKDVAARDELFISDYPFDRERSIAKTVNRFSGIIWGNEHTAIVTDNWFTNRNTKTYIIDPSTGRAEKIFDRNYQDVYNDPGSFYRDKNNYNEYVLNLKNGKALLTAAGYSKDGQFPFINEKDLSTKATTKIYQSTFKDKAENIIQILDRDKELLLVSIQSPTEYPNYFIRDLKSGKLHQLTHFENPFKQLTNVKKELITYKRADGLELTGTLYLPANYNGKQRLPLIMWAYPREFKDLATAGQNTSNPNDFIYPYYGSPIYWVTRGYAILDDASFPIVGVDNKQPNDNFVQQLVANAKAAIDDLDKKGIIDPKRVAVGGHSYGAFMTANLLTHSNLFAAGIARSGAYNRTLTPFGFQSEERNYWEVPEVYNTMSPFQNAQKMKTPLLLIHGNDDNNSGTFTMQSERYFSALKGLGAPARLVLLPKESHGYAAKESILHVLWEQDQWLEKYVKNKKETNVK